jgi:type IV secretion system protein VirB6
MGIAHEVEEAIDLLLDKFVTSKSEALCGAMAPIALAGISIHFVLIGFMIMRGEVEEPIQTFLWKTFRAALITGIALNGGEYQSVVVNASQGLVAALLGSLSGFETVGAVIDDIAEPFAILGQQLYNDANTGFWPSFGLLAAAGMVAIAEFLMVAIGLGFFLLAKVGLALVLGIGPAFVLCALWPSTEKYTESWIGQLLNFIVLKVLVALCILMLTDFSSKYASHIVENPETINVLRATISLLMCCGALVVVMLNLPQLASALSGGASISGVGRTVGRALLDVLNKSSNSSKPKPAPVPKPQTRHPMPGSPPPRNQRPGGRIENASPNAIPSNPLYRRNTIERVRNKT